MNRAYNEWDVVAVTTRPAITKARAALDAIDQITISEDKPVAVVKARYARMSENAEKIDILAKMDNSSD